MTQQQFLDTAEAADYEGFSLAQDAEFVFISHRTLQFAENGMGGPFVGFGATYIAKTAASPALLAAIAKRGTV